MKRKRADASTATDALPVRTIQSPESQKLVSPLNRDAFGGPRSYSIGSHGQLKAVSRPSTVASATVDMTKAPSTPRRVQKTALTNGNLSTPRTADRSARKKSAKRLIERSAVDDVSGEDELAEEEALAHRILDDDEHAGDDIDHEEQGEEQLLPPDSTPSRGRGQEKQSKRRRTPTPPRNLLAHELYFFQNRPGATKTSNNTLGSVDLISHENYFKQMRSFVDSHGAEQDFLLSLHKRSYDQWVFELEESFNLCFYGWGSKRGLLNDFAADLAVQMPAFKIIVVNGYTLNLTIRDILSAIAGVIPSLKGQNPGAQPADALEMILTGLNAEPRNFRIALIIHSIDAPALRRNTTQILLAKLSSSSSISMIASADHPNFPILWDISLRSQYNFLYHDVTTYQPFESELSVVEEVNQLFGRSGRRIDGREGVAYVLKSLTENARRLYALLVAEQLSAGIEDDEINGAEDDEEDFEVALSGTQAKGKLKPAGATADGRGIEYRSLYRKAMGQLIATHEMGFRTLLKEFYDHQMIVSKKDKTGAELLSVPFRKEELEAILEDLGD